MEPNKTNITGSYAALLAGTEIGLGSLLHMWHIPLSGHFLSLNQGFILSKATQKSKNYQTAMEISLVVATLKSLSPVGKRLTPMLAITVQGFLFSLGQMLLGVNLFGAIVGMLLLCLWTYVQMILVYILTFGTEIISVAHFFLNKLPKILPFMEPNLVSLILIPVTINLFVAVVVAVLSFINKGTKYENYLLKISEKRMGGIFQIQNPGKLVLTLSLKEKVLLVFKDLLRPWYLISLLMMVLFFVINKSDQVQIMWYLLRTAAVSFLIFYTLRFLPVDQWFQKIFGSKGNIGSQINYVLQNIKGKQ